MEPGERYGVYDHFAWFYSKGWGLDYHKQARPVLENHVFPRIAAGARVLDVCCGSGDLSRVLVERGYDVTGIDGSAEMLRYARRHLSGPRFRLEDARDFHYEPEFHAALSTFDSLNHVLALTELESVFANVYGALLPGGLFVFDLNMEAAFETLWRGSFSSMDDSAVGITNGSYDAAEKIGRAQITLFRPESGNLWRRSDVTVLEKCYTEDEITCGLARAGFTGVESHEAWELGMRGEIALGRNFFFATKPQQP